MITFKKFPWVSLALLLAAYGTLGWLLSAFHDPMAVWVMIVVGVLLVNASLSSPWSRIRNGFTRLVASDKRAFMFAVAVALSSVLIITWLHIFAHALVVISACTLFRLDAQTAGLKEMQIFSVSSVVSLSGLGLGAVAHALM